MEFPSIKFERFVSSMPGFLEENPGQRVSYAQFENEITHLRDQGKFSKMVTLVSFLFAALILAGILGGGHFGLGMFIAVGAIAGLHSYACDQAKASLRDRQFEWERGGVSLSHREEGEEEGSILSTFFRR